MPQLDEIHAALSKPTIFDKLRERTSTEANQLLDKGKMTYVAKKTFDSLPNDVQATLPKPLQEKLSSVAWPAFSSMLERMHKEAGIIGQTVGRAAGMVKKNPLAATEVAGLGVLAAPGLDTLQAHVRARMAGDKTPEGTEKRQFMGEAGHAAADVGGLGILMHPELKHLIGKHAFANSAYAGNVAQNGPGSRSHSPLAPFTAPVLAKKEASALRRAGELLSGSKVKTLESAAEKHFSTSMKKRRESVKPGIVALALEKTHDFNTHPAGGKGPGSAYAHVLGKANRLADSASREAKASVKIRGLVRKEALKSTGAVMGATALATGVPAGIVAIKQMKSKKKEAGMGVGAGMSTSQYSGRLSDGAFKMKSPAPPFTSPEMDSKKEASAFVREFTKLWKEAGGMNTATDAMHAQGRLHATQSIGAPKTTAPAGPSIAQVSKPQGFGSPIAGAKKNML